MIWVHNFKIDSGQRPTMRSSAFTVSLQVMVASAFYVNCSFLGRCRRCTQYFANKRLHDMTNEHITKPVRSCDLARNMIGSNW